MSTLDLISSHTVLAVSWEYLAKYSGNCSCAITSNGFVFF